MASAAVRRRGKADSVFQYELTAQQALDVDECLSYLIKVMLNSPTIREAATITPEEVARLRDSINEQHPTEELLRGTRRNQ